MPNERPLSPPRPRPPKSKIFTTLSLVLIFMFIGLFTVLIYATADKFSHDERVENAKNSGKGLTILLNHKTLPTGMKDMKKKSKLIEPIVIPEAKFSIETTIEFENKWGKPQKMTIPLDLAENVSKRELYTNLVNDLKNTEKFAPFVELANKMSSWKQMKNIKPNSKVTVTLKIVNCSNEEVVSTHIIKAKNKKLYIKQISEAIYNEVDFFANDALAKIAAEVPLVVIEDSTVANEIETYEYSYYDEGNSVVEEEPNNPENEIVIDTDALVDDIFNGADQVWSFFETDEKAEAVEGKKASEAESSWW